MATDKSVDWKFINDIGVMSLSLGVRTMLESKRVEALLDKNQSEISEFYDRLKTISTVSSDTAEKVMEIEDILGRQIDLRGFFPAPSAVRKPFVGSNDVPNPQSELLNALEKIELAQEVEMGWLYINVYKLIHCSTFLAISAVHDLIHTLNEKPENAAVDTSIGSLEIVAKKSVEGIVESAKSWTGWTIIEKTVEASKEIGELASRNQSTSLENMINDAASANDQLSEQTAMITALENLNKLTVQILEEAIDLKDKSLKTTEDIPTTMQAVLLTAHGGPEVLQIASAHPVPTPASSQVLIKVAACAVNNTDINTRIGWYSKAVREDTASAATDHGVADGNDSSWSGASIDFPRIQGADICGKIVGVGSDVDPARIGERVLVQSMQPQPDNNEGLHCITIGSEIDGGFAEYVVASSDMVIAVDSQLSDAELAAFPCAYSTAENMLERIALKAEDKVLITGASGGVGSAAVQLAKRRGCHVTAITSASKADFVRDLGADEVLDRTETPPSNRFNVCVDVVAGDAFTSLLDALKRGGRYVCAGAIAGPIVELDVRTLYLKDLTLAGSTWQAPTIMKNLVQYIEHNEIRPTVSKTYPLSAIAQAQADFASKAYPGKLVLVPDALFDPSI